MIIHCKKCGKLISGGHNMHYCTECKNARYKAGHPTNREERREELRDIRHDRKQDTMWYKHSRKTDKRKFAKCVEAFRSIH